MFGNCWELMNYETYKESMLQTLRMFGDGVEGINLCYITNSGAPQQGCHGNRALLGTQLSPRKQGEEGQGTDRDKVVPPETGKDGQGWTRLGYCVAGAGG